MDIKHVLGSKMEENGLSGGRVLLEPVLFPDIVSSLGPDQISMVMLTHLRGGHVSVGHCVEDLTRWDTPSSFSVNKKRWLEMIADQYLFGLKHALITWSAYDRVKSPILTVTFPFGTMLGLSVINKHRKG